MQPLKLLPRVGEMCAKAARDAYVEASTPGEPAPPFEESTEFDHRRWEAVAMAAVTEYETQMTAAEVNDRWHESAVRDLLKSGG